MSSSSDESNGEQIIEQLKTTVQAIIKKTGADNLLVRDLVQKIDNLQQKLVTLTSAERSKFLHDMKDTFKSTIERLEKKITQHERFASVYSYSILAAVGVIFFFIIALFGYKLYKSLKEKELKKQGKSKKQSKKTKKAN